MPVPEQIPYVGYIANGQTTEFPITFDLHDPEFLIVTLNKEIPIVGAFTIDMNAKKVVFTTAPNDNDQVELYRETELNRDTDYKSYDNSFRPEAVNYDLDTIVRILQEQHMIDAKIAARIKDEIEWRRTHDFNYDELAQVREKQSFDALKGYVDTLVASVNPGIFQGVIAGVVFAKDGKSIQTHLDEILDELENSRLDVSKKADITYVDGKLLTKADKIVVEDLAAKKADKSYVDDVTSGISAGYEVFATQAQLLATTPTVAKKAAKALDTGKVWLWEFGSWHDSGLSELDQSKNFTIQEIINLLNNLNASSDLVVDSEGNRYLFSVLSQTLQKIMFGVTSKADFIFGDLQLSEIDGQWLLADKSGRTFLRYANDSLYFLNLKIDLNKVNGVLHISDNSGKTLFRLSEKGTLYASKYVGLPEQLGLEASTKWQLSDFNLMLVYGQSLSRGSTAQPIISNVQNYQNVMLKSGVLTRSNENGYDKSAFVPLIENWTETPASGICNQLSKRFQDINHQLSPVFASASTGDGGRTIDELSKNGLGFFENTIEQIRDMHALAQSKNKTFSVLTYNWFQGESNQYADDSNTESLRVYEYVSKLFKLKYDFDSEVIKITGQNFLPKICMYQVASHRRLYQSKNMRVALAQLKMCNENDDFIMSTPAYCLKHNTDHLHLTSEGSWLLGAYNARAINETIFMSNKWKPLQPSFVEWGVTEIIVGGWNSRGTTLVLDNALCALTENFGFDLFTPDAVLIDIISSVTLVDKNTIKITLSEPAPNNAILCCGRGRDYMNSNDLGGELTGSRTNIRDNHGDFDEVTSPTGTTYKLHNASVMWQYSRKDGFNAV